MIGTYEKNESVTILVDFLIIWYPAALYLLDITQRVWMCDFKDSFMRPLFRLGPRNPMSAWWGTKAWIFWITTLRCYDPSRIFFQENRKVQFASFATAATLMIFWKVENFIGFGQKNLSLMSPLSKIVREGDRKRVRLSQKKRNKDLERALAPAVNKKQPEEANKTHRTLWKLFEQSSMTW